MSGIGEWVEPEYDIGYIEGWAVLRRGGDYYKTLPPAWKIYARVGDSDAARKVVKALMAL